MANLRRFIVVLTIYTTWIAICATVFGLVLDFFDTPYFSFGPSSNLYILGLGVVIDTWLKYCLLILYAIVNPFISVYTGDTIYPWINSVVMNPDIKTIDIPKPVAWLVTNYMWTINALSYLFSIGLSMTQFDLFLATNVSAVISGAITSFIALSGKSTHMNNVDIDMDEV